jgi:hypothetical protein
VSAGADAAVSRGELLGSFPGLVKRWLGEDPTGGDGARIRGG